MKKLLFRIECPHCGWGYKWNDDYINAGWIKLTCKHCGKTFHTKITVTGININIKKDIML